MAKSAGRALYDASEREFLRGALKLYGQHLPDCMGGLSGGKRPCTCGLDQAIAGNYDESIRRSNDGTAKRD